MTYCKVTWPKRKLSWSLVQQTCSKACGWGAHRFWWKFTTDVFLSGHTVKQSSKCSHFQPKASAVLSHRQRGVFCISGRHGDSEMFKMPRINDWRVLNLDRTYLSPPLRLKEHHRRGGRRTLRARNWGCEMSSGYSTILTNMNTQNPGTSRQDWFLQHSIIDGEMGQGVHDHYQEAWLGTNWQGGWERGSVWCD